MSSAPPVSQYGFLLQNGTRIVHGASAPPRDAFPPALNIPGRLQTLSSDNANDPSTPCFCGPQGLLPFDTQTRMPRHVHMAPVEAANDPSRLRYVVEKIMVMEGVARAELGGELYVVPPHTLVVIGAGVPHAWTACPSGVDFRQLGFFSTAKKEEDDEEEEEAMVISRGKFVAVFEYEVPTAFFPTRQTQTLTTQEEYVPCDDLQEIRIPALTVEEVMARAWFVWGGEARKLSSVAV